MYTCGYDIINGFKCIHKSHENESKVIALQPTCLAIKVTQVISILPRDDAAMTACSKSRTQNDPTKSWKSGEQSWLKVGKIILWADWYSKLWLIFMQSATNIWFDVFSVLLFIFEDTQSTFNCNLQWTAFAPPSYIKISPIRARLVFCWSFQFPRQETTTGLQKKSWASQCQLPTLIRIRIVQMSKWLNRDIPKINGTIQIARTGWKSYFSSSWSSKLPLRGSYTTWSNTIQLAVAKCHYTLWLIEMFNEKSEEYETLCKTQHVYLHVPRMYSLSLSLWKALNPCPCGRNRVFYFHMCSSKTRMCKWFTNVITNLNISKLYYILYIICAYSVHIAPHPHPRTWSFNSPSTPRAVEVGVAIIGSIRCKTWKPITWK